jgi:hypothetical protein
MCGGSVLGSCDMELGLAKGGIADAVFGNLSCIMLGDFAQLSPVGDSALTIYPCDQAESMKKGLRLWHEEINTVIALTTVHRVDDPIFLEVLDRLRWVSAGLPTTNTCSRRLEPESSSPISSGSYWWQATKCAKASTKHSGPSTPCFANPASCWLQRQTLPAIGPYRLLSRWSSEKPQNQNVACVQGGCL